MIASRSILHSARSLPTMEQPKPSEFVTLVSDDGFEFIISREAACVSGTIRRMLDPSSKRGLNAVGSCSARQLT